MSGFKPYPAYKDSGVEWLGEVPKHWVVTKFSRHFSVRMGETIPETELSDEGWLPVYSATERDKFYGYVDERKPLVENGDLVIPARGNSIGFVKLVRASATATQTTIVANVLDHRITDSAYVYYWCLGLRRILFYFDRTAIPQITTEYVSRNPLLLPALAEQTQIARFLDHETARIDALIAEQQRMIELLKEKRQAVISHAVTKGLDPTVPMKDSGEEWLGEVPEHWVVRKVSFDFSATKGPRGALLTKEYCHENPGEYPVYSGQTENGGVLGEIADYDFDLGSEGAILSTTVGAKAMSVSHVTGQISLSQNCMIIKSINPNIGIKFFFYHFQPLFLLERKMIPDHMQPSFRMEDLYAFRIATPPEKEQTQIAHFLDHETARIDALISDQQQMITLLKEKRIALISAVVTGKIDVRNT